MQCHDQELKLTEDQSNQPSEKSCKLTVAIVWYFSNDSRRGIVVSMSGVRNSSSNSSGINVEAARIHERIVAWVASCAAYYDGVYEIVAICRASNRI